MHIAIIGGGPAGLRAAEVAASGGASVTVFDGKASVGRKFLVAGRGGLNLTNTEPREQFAARYSGPRQPPDIWFTLLADFDAEALRDWASGLGVETFVASTGRIFPKGLKAAPLLRRWVQRLREHGVEFALHHRWTALTPGVPLRIEFDVKGETRTHEADAIILALGGASWPETGSDGAWHGTLEKLGVTVAPWQPANCGWEVEWPPDVLARAEGHPLKNLIVHAGDAKVAGELLVTKFGLEGGAIYQLGPVLRQMPEPEITIDFKPDLTVGALVEKARAMRGGIGDALRMRWKLTHAAFAIVTGMPGAPDSAQRLAERVKRCTLRLTRHRSLAEAISSAGGVCWNELDADLMLKRLPGVFVAGEMVDWEAPTGGYLIQGCLSTGTRAGRGALQWFATK